MKQTTVILCVLILVPGMLLPAGAAPKLSDEDAVKNTLIAMWAAIERSDIEAYAKFLHPDISAFGETDPYLAEGKRLEVIKVKGWLKKASNVHTEMHHPKVTVRGNTAWITYYWTDWGEEGGKRFSSKGKSTRIFVKEKGKWLCIHAHHTLVN